MHAKIMNSSAQTINVFTNHYPVMAKTIVVITVMRDIIVKVAESFYIHLLIKDRKNMK